MPTFAYAVGAGPLTDSEDRDAVRTVLADMDDVVVRDEESRLVLEEVGLEREVTVTADPALLLGPEPFTEAMMRDEGIPSGARLVGMSVREPGRAAEKLDEGDYHALLADVADFLVRRLDAHVVFLPMERHDVRHAHAVQDPALVRRRHVGQHGVRVPYVVPLHRQEHHVRVQPSHQEVGDVGEQRVVVALVQLLGGPARFAHRHPHQPGARGDALVAHHR
ncbi:polysaccharide pyruvyl transferase family protein, partial [Streptomyces rochei]|uniref:polysaccharide pyruvyl transferase family protein n=1 Tax=Streptomyces rochei TaxID=1928 RepID=UPI003A5988FF